MTNDLPHTPADQEPAWEPTTPTALEPPPPPSRNFVLRHWRGECSLPFSYWVVGSALSLLMLWLMNQLWRIESLKNLGQRSSGAVILLVYALLIAVTTWQMVGIWRSASAYSRRGGEPMWEILAKLMVLIAVLRNGVEMVNVGYPLMREGVQLLAGVEHTPAYAIRLLRDGTELELSGGMPYGTTDAVQQALDGAPKVTVIHLNSQGGRMQEAYKLYKTIQARKLTTYTSGQCASACAFAFLAGHERLLGENGRLGFHSVSLGGLSGKELTEVNDEYRRTLKANGVPDGFIDHALSTAPKDIWFPSKSELLDNKVITAVVDSGAFAISGQPQWHSAQDIEADLLKLPVYAALSQYDATNYARLRDLWVSGVQNGRTFKEIQAGMHAILMNDIVPGYLQRAQDAAVVNYWRTQIAEMQGLARTSQQLCADFAFPAFAHQPVNLISALPKDLLTQDMQALAALIESGAKHPYPAKAPTTQSKADFQAAFLRMNQKLPNGLDVMSTPEKFKNNPAALCTATVALYQEILATPGEQRLAAVLRQLH